MYQISSPYLHGIKSIFCLEISKLFCPINYEAIYELLYVTKMGTWHLITISYSIFSSLKLVSVNIKEIRNFGIFDSSLGVEIIIT